MSIQCIVGPLPTWPKVNVDDTNKLYRELIERLCFFDTVTRAASIERARGDNNTYGVIWIDMASKASIVRVTKAEQYIIIPFAGEHYVVAANHIYPQQTLWNERDLSNRLPTLWAIVERDHTDKATIARALVSLDKCFHGMLYILARLDLYGLFIRHFRTTTLFDVEPLDKGRARAVRALCAEHDRMCYKLTTTTTTTSIQDTIDQHLGTMIERGSKSDNHLYLSLLEIEQKTRASALEPDLEYNQSNAKKLTLFDESIGNLVLKRGLEFMPPFGSELLNLALRIDPNDGSERVFDDDMAFFIHSCHDEKAEDACHHLITRWQAQVNVPQPVQLLSSMPNDAYLPKLIPMSVFVTRAGTTATTHMAVRVDNDDDETREFLARIVAASMLAPTLALVPRHEDRSSSDLDLYQREAFQEAMKSMSTTLRRRLPISLESARQQKTMLANFFALTNVLPLPSLSPTLPSYLTDTFQLLTRATANTSAIAASFVRNVVTQPVVTAFLKQELVKVTIVLTLGMARYFELIDDRLAAYATMGTVLTTRALNLWNFTRSVMLTMLAIAKQQLVKMNVTGSALSTALDVVGAVTAVAVLATVSYLQFESSLVFSLLQLPSATLLRLTNGVDSDLLRLPSPTLATLLLFEQGEQGAAKIFNDTGGETPFLEWYMQNFLAGDIIRLLLRLRTGDQRAENGEETMWEQLCKHSYSGPDVL